MGLCCSAVLFFDKKKEPNYFLLQVNQTLINTGNCVLNTHYTNNDSLSFRIRSKVKIMNRLLLLKYYCKTLCDNQTQKKFE